MSIASQLSYRHCEGEARSKPGLSPRPPQKGGSHGLDCFAPLAMTSKEN
jgi:hypothetical protein